MMEKPTKTGELRLGLLKVGHGAPGKRKSDSGHVVVRFADDLDGVILYSMRDLRYLIFKAFRSPW